MGVHFNSADQSSSDIDVSGLRLTGFVVTSDMNIRLKHQVRRLTYDSQAATFVKNYVTNREQRGSSS